MGGVHKPRCLHGKGDRTDFMSLQGRRKQSEANQRIHPTSSSVALPVLDKTVHFSSPQYIISSKTTLSQPTPNVHAHSVLFVEVLCGSEESELFKLFLHRWLCDFLGQLLFQSSDTLEPELNTQGFSEKQIQT